MLKEKRHAKILEIIRKNEIGTQEELCQHLNMEGYQVTQATVSRDIRELKLTKVSHKGGKQKYASLSDTGNGMSEKYTRIFQEGVVAIDMAQNILVIHTVSGMAMAVAAALDTFSCQEIVGSIAGDDTIMCAVRSVEDTISLMRRLRKLLQTQRE